MQTFQLYFATDVHAFVKWRNEMHVELNFNFQLTPHLGYDLVVDAVLDRFVFFSTDML